MPELTRDEQITASIYIIIGIWIGTITTLASMGYEGSTHNFILYAVLFGPPLLLWIYGSLTTPKKPT